jgi:uncharacterized damage-inducible protein DinB
MHPHRLQPPEGYDPRAVATCALAAQLDPLLRSLTHRVQGASIAELEWQLRPGVNTIGMLLAHLAVVEVFWMQAATRGIDSHDESDRIVLDTLGIHMEDDGLPLPPDGIHPPALAGRTAAEYLELLRRARRATHETLRGWDDSTLEQTRLIDGGEVSCGWILFHVVEHFAHHLGQIGLLASLRHASAGG